WLDETFNQKLILAINESIARTIDRILDPAIGPRGCEGLLLLPETRAPRRRLRGLAKNRPRHPPTNTQHQRRRYHQPKSHCTSPRPPRPLPSGTETVH